jgi:hypothetical protein
LLRGDILSGPISPSNSQEVEAAFLSTEAGRQIGARDALFAVKHSSYSRDQGDVVRALVKVEDLERAEQKGQSKVDQTPPSTIRYVDDLKGVDSVYSVVLIFPREALGDEDVTVVLPFGGKTGLTPTFQPVEMVVIDKQEFQGYGFWLTVSVNAHGHPSLRRGGLLCSRRRFDYKSEDP